MDGDDSRSSDDLTILVRHAGHRTFAVFEQIFRKYLLHRNNFHIFASSKYEEGFD